MMRWIYRPLPGGALLAGSLLAVAALAGCGSGPAAGHGGTPQGGGTPDPSTAAIVACYRAHGDPGFPDPVFDPGDDRWHFAISPGSAPLATQQACRHLFPVAEASPPIAQAQFQALVRLAECLRQHGVTGWPDPDPDGSFGLPSSLSPKDHSYDHAFQACQRYLPSGGHLDVHMVP